MVLPSEAEGKAVGDVVGGRRFGVMAREGKAIGPRMRGRVPGSTRMVRRIPKAVRDPKKEVFFVVSRYTGRETHRLATKSGRPKVYRGRIEYIEGYMPHSSWVFMVHLVRYSKFRPAVAVEFLDGVTCYYPGTTRQQYMTFKRRVSAGKHIHKYYYHRPYVVI